MSKLLCKLDGGWEIKSDSNGFQMINSGKNVAWYFSSLEELLRDALREGLKHHLKGTDSWIEDLEAAKDWCRQIINAKPTAAQRPLKRTNEFYTHDEKEVLRNDTFFA